MSQDIYNQEYLKRLQLADQQATCLILRSESLLVIRTRLHSFWRFMDLPIEVITEVLCNVTPFELLSLSHTCKFLQEMIMRRTAEYVWLTAERNSATYPSYPWADISKPHFAGLLFMMLCTACGNHTANPLDPFLLVRLCSKCCSTEQVAHVFVSPKLTFI
ncbi:F-box protein [Rhizoctonia solani 123E]|uniref:F-box protein n=1 Tax=Rhizoctonia solani 123E TaxID=1423351 RepID=A0A074RXP3_9AGAM|nr:F-box protein [Rhizoctonia solani 123E]